MKQEMFNNTYVFRTCICRLIVDNCLQSIWVAQKMMAVRKLLVLRTENKIQQKMLLWGGHRGMPTADEFMVSCRGKGIV